MNLCNKRTVPPGTDLELRSIMRREGMATAEASAQWLTEHCNKEGCIMPGTKHRAFMAVTPKYVVAVYDVGCTTQWHTDDGKYFRPQSSMCAIKCVAIENVLRVDAEGIFGNNVQLLRWTMLDRDVSPEDCESWVNKALHEADPSFEARAAAAEILHQERVQAKLMEERRIELRRALLVEDHDFETEYIVVELVRRDS